MHAINQHVLVEVLHALLLEEAHFVVRAVRLKHLLVNFVEGVAEVSHEVRLAPRPEAGHHTLELVEVIGHRLASVIGSAFFLRKFEEVECLAIVSATVVEVVLLHVKKAELVVKYMKTLN